MEREYLETISKIFTILASISVIISVFVKEAPSWLLYVGIVLIIIFSLIPIYPKIKSRIDHVKKNRLAKKYFYEFRDLVDRFSNYVNPNRTNIPYLLKSIINAQSKDYEQISLPSTNNILAIFNPFRELVKNFNGKKDDLILLIKMFYGIVDMYNKDYVCYPVTQIKNKKKEIKEDDRDKYKEQKHTYTLFLEDCKKFGEKINKIFGEDTGRYFEFPKDL